MFTATGRLIYDPVVKRAIKKSDWWCIASVSNDLVKYYQFFLIKLFAPYFDLSFEDTIWKGHVSIVQGTIPPNIRPWKRYEGEWIKFTYDHYLYRVGDFFCIDVTCEFFENLREELGLPRKCAKPFHITIGRIRKKVFLEQKDNLDQLCNKLGIPLLSANPPSLTKTSLKHASFGNNHRQKDRCPSKSLWRGTGNHGSKNRSLGL